jgi:hypothetical protein
VFGSGNIKFSKFYIFNIQIYHCKVYLGKDAWFASDILLNDFAKPSINPRIEDLMCPTAA